MELAGLTVAFVVVIVMAIKGGKIGPAMFLGAFIVGLSQGLGLPGTLAGTYRALTSPDSVELIVVVALITVLARTMKDYGLLDRMVESLSTLMLGPKLTIAAVPAIIGIMPVSGGAIMSAPVVGSLGDELNLEEPRKAAVNLVFRHFAMITVPFLPPVVLASQLTGVKVSALLKLLAPVSAFSLAIAYIVLLRSVKAQRRHSEWKAWRYSLLEFTKSSMPLFIPLVLHIVFGLPLIWSLVAGVTMSLYMGRGRPDFSPRIVFEGIDRSIVLAMAGIMTFRGMVANSDVLSYFVGRILDAGIPVGLILVGVPMIIGFLTASPTSSVGIAFPFLIPLMGSGQAEAAYAVAVFLSAFIAYFISPLHLCQVVTNEYFKVRLGELYRQYVMVIPSFFIALLGLLAYAASMAH